MSLINKFSRRICKLLLPYHWAWILEDPRAGAAKVPVGLQPEASGFEHRGVDSFVHARLLQYHSVLYVTYPGDR